MTTERKISGEVYVVIDPSMEESELLNKLEQVLAEDIAAVQVWDNFPAFVNKIALVNRICNACHKKNVPVILNNEADLLEYTAADGIHFDQVPKDFEDIKKRSGQGHLFGITCTNDLSVVEWAERNQLDYISFCSVFPSQSSNSCEPVSFESIRKARNITSLPLFLAGGIRTGNIKELKTLDFEGVAVISGIMSAENPGKAIKEYLKEIKSIKNENSDHQ
jgi:thiamine-phosphate pyrophosphorylase